MSITSMMYKIVTSVQGIAAPPEGVTSPRLRLRYCHCFTKVVTSVQGIAAPPKGVTSPRLHLRYCHCFTKVVTNVQGIAAKRLPRLAGQRGMSLVELLVAMGIVVILGSIATVSYRSYILPMHLLQLKDASQLFNSSFQSCIGSAGWKITKFDGTTVKPCNTLEKMGFTCPTQNAGTCQIDHSDDSTTDPTAVCIYIKQTIQGKDHHLYVKSDPANRTNYRIACTPSNEHTTGVVVTNKCTSNFSAFTGNTQLREYRTSLNATDKKRYEWCKK